MTILEHIGLWGSIASIIGLIIAFFHIVSNRKRIRKLEQVWKINVETESQARASAEAKAGDQTANQSIGSITQSVGGPGHHGFHRITCPHLPDVRNEVDALIDAKGVAHHVVCSELQEDYSCKAESNSGRECRVINPAAIRSHRSTLRAQHDGLVG
jgi:hypothetical protein